MKLPLVSGHRQTGLTECPGNHLWARLAEIRRAVYDLGLPKFFRPKQSDGSVDPLVDSDRFTARGTEDLQWVVDIIDGSGNSVRTLNAQGRYLSATWDGTDANGLPVAPGTYSATILGQTSDGRSARPALLPVTVISPTPRPSPTPTSSPSPSPSPSISPSPSRSQR